MALILEMVSESTVKAKPLCYMLIVSALVLGLLGCLEVYVSSSIVSAVGACRVSGWAGRGQAGSGESQSSLALCGHSMGMNPIIQFYTPVHRFRKVLWFFDPINMACPGFSGKTTVEGGLLCITIVFQDAHQTLELRIVLAKFLVPLSDLVKLHRHSSHLVRVTKGGLEDGYE
jgi:hypothetical protein